MPLGIIRRKDRRIGDEECRDLLRRGEYATLATVDAAGQPYATPLSYIHRDGGIYFHCALEGHKLDNLRHNPRACLSVVGGTEAFYGGGFSTVYESVVIFGTVREITDEAEKYAALYALAEKYLPEHMEHAEPDITKYGGRTLVFALTPETMTGKALRRK